MKGNYRKYNDPTNGSSTYHKKDGTCYRAKIKVETVKEFINYIKESITKK